MTGQDLLNIVLNEGVEVKEKHEDLIQEFDEAIIENRVCFIPKGSDIVGFCTWEEKKGKVLINKCVVLKKYRSRFSLIELRHYFRDMFKDMQFYWKSRKRNKVCWVR